MSARFTGSDFVIGHSDELNLSDTLHPQARKSGIWILIASDAGGNGLILVETQVKDSRTGLGHRLQVPFVTDADGVVSYLWGWDNDLLDIVGCVVNDLGLSVFIHCLVTGDGRGHWVISGIGLRILDLGGGGASRSRLAGKIRPANHHLHFGRFTIMTNRDFDDVIIE